ncbi:MAG: cryptochrome/photolyase family protein [Planctomycetales bacterium]|nr:cryptochrome/photolyase family protein [Planctomycetales bacterium]
MTDNDCRNLVVVLGDQLNHDSTALNDFDKDADVIWMAEVADESTHVWTHKARIAIFLAAMRHFRISMERRHWRIVYRKLDDHGNKGSLSEELGAAIRRLKPQQLIVTEPGEWRVQQALQKVADDHDVPLEIRVDAHFMCNRDEFAEHAASRKQLRMEYFYRELRARYDILMKGNKPIGGQWNFDKDNRGSFGRDGPQNVKQPKSFRPDSVTKEVLELVEQRFAEHPGSLATFDWPVTPRQAATALDDFIENRLAHFGEFQDAMWTAEPYLFHSRLIRRDESEVTESARRHRGRRRCVSGQASSAASRRRVRSTDSRLA